MRTELFDYELPDELIAARPPEARDSGRLLDLSVVPARDHMVLALPEFLRESDLVVVNETRVRRARLKCRRPEHEGGGGAQVELLFLGQLQGEVHASSSRVSLLGPAGGEVWEALGKANRPLREGDVLQSEAGRLVVGPRRDQGLLTVITPPGFEEKLALFGGMPIPPYMQRPADDDDALRYQTVFARDLGSAAAPTAGLHLTEELLRVIEARGARLASLTLHVGIGTFRPVKVEDLDEHPMHAEWIRVGAELSDAIRETRARGGRVVAVGTTVVRALESAADPSTLGLVTPQGRETDILIQPGYRFRVVDCLLTNFHQPRSTLLALVCAFSGRQRVLDAYRHAVSAGYRFLSYGDAMWLERSEDGGAG